MYAHAILFELGTNMVQRYSTVYDIGDPTKTLDSKWFELERRDKRWTKDLVGRKPRPNTNAQRCYAAEHVLEWQTLKIFIEADRDKGDDSRCVFLHKYFKQSMPLRNHKVQVAKGNGKLGKDGHFDYEEKDYAFGKWENIKQNQPRAIDWIST
jgi:hypothetical protein